MMKAFSGRIFHKVLTKILKTLPTIILGTFQAYPVIAFEDFFSSTNMQCFSSTKLSENMRIQAITVYEFYQIFAS